jgi:hypothetical protein
MPQGGCARAGQRLASPGDVASKQAVAQPDDGHHQEEGIVVDVAVEGSSASQLLGDHVRQLAPSPETRRPQGRIGDRRGPEDRAGASVPPMPGVFGAVRGLARTMMR